MVKKRVASPCENDKQSVTAHKIIVKMWCYKEHDFRITRFKDFIKNKLVVWNFSYDGFNFFVLNFVWQLDN